MTSDKRSLHNLPFLAISFILCLVAMWGGLIRMGWRLPNVQSGLSLEHGPLMASGFFGTLISLERAVALRKKWTYLGPLMSGVGGLLIATGKEQLGMILLTLGSAWLVIMFIPILHHHLAAYSVIMGLGALSLFIGNLLWILAWPVYKFVLWWAGFLVLTIAGERLELGRVRKQSPSSTGTFNIIAGVYMLGLVTMLGNFDLGTRLISGATIALSVWLLKYDIARHTIRKEGLTRYIALALLSGYVWLGVSGAIGLWKGGLVAGSLYDALLHSVFIGFVFAMIFGHAPIIFPAVLSLPVKYTPVFYGPLVLLHLSMLLRLGGDFSGLLWAQQWGGIINAIAILSYLLLLSPLADKVVEKT